MIDSCKKSCESYRPFTWKDHDKFIRINLIFAGFYIKFIVNLLVAIRNGMEAGIVLQLKYFQVDVEKKIKI